MVRSRICSLIRPTASSIKRTSGASKRMRLTTLSEAPCCRSLALVLDEVDAGAGMPAGRIFGEQQQRRHVGAGDGARVIEQMIGVAQDRLRILTRMKLVDELGDQIDVEVVPSGVEGLLALVKNVALGFFERVNLLPRQGRCFGGDAIKRTAAGDAMNLHAGSDFELEQLQIAEANLFAGRRELGAQQVLRRLDQRLQLVAGRGECP